MKINLLGTNGWYDSSTGNTTCILVQTENANIVLDAGNGIYKLDRYIKENKKSQVFMFLSHFHLDHIAGLHILCKFNKVFKRLRICGPKGTKNVIKTLINKPFTVPVSDLEYEMDVNELPEEKPYFPFKLKTLPLLHADLTLGYRIEFGGKTLAYCPDTGYCKNAVELSKNADLLITECSFRSGEFLEEWPHLNPEEAARIAKEGNAKKLLLVHFSPGRFPDLKSREEAAEDAGKIFPGTIAGTDGMEIKI